MEVDISGSITSYTPIFSFLGKLVHTAIGVRKTLVLHKQIKNRPTLAYKNSVRKCYEDMFFITKIHFNNLTSSPQT